MEEARSPEGQRVTTAAGVLGWIKLALCPCRLGTLRGGLGASKLASKVPVLLSVAVVVDGAKDRDGSCQPFTLLERQIRAILLLIPAIGTFSQSRCVLRRISLVQYLDWGLPSQFPLRWLASALMF
ncbi:uncharacterized protein CIMG_13556 [Coccidioides immitis RS]|uniref:Uncharacterized protein n=1 Tax=Coccidioides immitis (strain RS) TaxID=246410 RepID=A0A0D8JYE3_COCIM|nr:uncharacterized protein CIMG_13556 [Coccidioides immitis RS]KJF61273.1 hypothetical protein CIMG_13556 [Coccidioides immitis RS]